MTKVKDDTPLAAIRRNVITGLAAIGLVGGGVFVWSVATAISGAVIANGSLVVESSVKKIQHPHGGVVADIGVRNGDRVRAGALLVRLDGTTARANLAIIEKSLDELAVRQARLESERDDESTLLVPASITVRAADAELRRAIGAEEKLFQLRRQARQGQKAQMKERMAQLDQEIRGLESQVQAKAREIALIERELEGVRELREKKLVPLARLTSLEREAARLQGERGQFIASIARARAKMAETQLQLIQIDQDLRSEVAKELRDIQAKAAELSERKVAAEDQLRRIELRSPIDGVVHQLAVHTLGGVVGQGEVMMVIVPESEKLVIEARVSPQEIDQVREGQKAVVRLTGLNQATTPELDGKVAVVSADLVQDQRTGQHYYTVRVSVAEAEFGRIAPVKLSPGMPVDVYVQTTSRTVGSYLIKPLRDQIARAFRER